MAFVHGSENIGWFHGCVWDVRVDDARPKKQISAKTESNF